MFDTMCGCIYFLMNEHFGLSVQRPSFWRHPFNAESKWCKTKFHQICSNKNKLINILDELRVHFGWTIPKDTCGWFVIQGWEKFKMKELALSDHELEFDSIGRSTQDVHLEWHEKAFTELQSKLF